MELKCYALDSVNKREEKISTENDRNFHTINNLNVEKKQ